ncbi:MAG: VWA domain-containing protein [Candidatus Coatesbacteria bacterium]|nr:VWA domain-containing protein [Candidatus Coatesbacteria bacterium]
MKFLNLSALPLLGLIPLIIIFYFLKLKREKYLIPSLFLWQKFLMDKQANSLFQRLRKNLLLFLQILFIGFIVFALLRPYWESFIAPNSLYCVLIDNSASMTTNEGNKTRLDIAKNEALKLIDNLKSNDKMIIVTCSNRIESVSGLSDEKSKLRLFIKQISQSIRPTDLSSGLNLLTSMAKENSNSYLFILSDGVTISPDDKFFFPGKILFKKIGEVKENIGISNFSIKRFEEGNREIFQCFLEVKNYGNEKKDFSISQIVDNRQLDIFNYTLSPQESKGSIINLDRSWDKITFKILNDDSYSIDNQVYAVLKGKIKPKVSVFSSNPGFLAGLLFAYKNVDVKFYSQVSAEFDFTNLPSDLIILDNISVKSYPPYPTFFIGSSPASTGKKAREQVYQIIDWDAKNPLNKYIQWNEVLFSSFNTDIRMPDFAYPLLYIGSNPIIWAGEQKGIKYLSWEFALSETDLPIHTSFVFAIINTLEWFEASNIVYYHNLSKDFTVPDIALYKNSFLRKEKIKKDIKVGSILPVDSAGFYTIEGDEGIRQSIAANFISSSESAISPSDIPNLRARQGKEIDKKIISQAEWWTYIALLGLLLLFIEWFIFTRWRKPRELMIRLGIIKGEDYGREGSKV